MPQSTITDWVRAVRAYSYPASIVPVALGAAFAWYQTGRFAIGLFVLTLLAGLLYQTGCNLLNDYYDHRYGVDREGTFGGSGVLVAKALAPHQVFLAGAGCLVAGSLIGLWFVRLHGWPLVAIGAAGFLGAVFYTATPASAKYNALGAPLVFLMMGVGMVLGSYLIQAGSLTASAAWVSLPVGFLVTAILHANDTRDIADDRASRIRTLSILVGPTAARAIFSALLAAAYASVVALALFGVAPWTVLFVLATTPIAWKLHRLFWDVRDEKSARLEGAVERTAQLHLAFGLLMTVGVIVGGF